LDLETGRSMYQDMATLALGLDFLKNVVTHDDCGRVPGPTTAFFLIFITRHQSDGLGSSSIHSLLHNIPFVSLLIFSFILLCDLASPALLCQGHLTCQLYVLCDQTTHVQAMRV
jgi:hypothetical protein